ncbi:MAG TPA: HXXEE domain-containing protein [Steroidobacteraceae bacterium]|nr:HXXEE domain-containing protein [Steroidobacteraceae bacterium]
MNPVFRAIPVRQLAWLLPAAFALHELEEWNIVAWYRRYWTNVDPALVNQRNSWTWLAFASLFGFLWTFLASRFRNPAIALHLLLVFFIAVFSHCFAHIYWLFSLGVYAPGVVTSIVLIIPITAYVTYRAIRERLVSSVFAAALFALTLLPLTWAIGLGNRLPDGGIPFLRFSSWLADLIVR